MSHVTSIVLELLRKSGVRDWEDGNTRAAIIAAANEIAEQTAANELADIEIDLRAVIVAAINGIHFDLELIDMAVTAVFRTQSGTAKTIKNSGGDAAITFASLANGNGTSAGARQAVTLDLGATRAKAYRVEHSAELAATPTAGAVINFYASVGNATGAGKGGTSGTDAAYTGYANNIDAAAKHLDFVGAFVCTADATATVQKGVVGVLYPKGRYVNMVVDNRCGAAYHNTETNQSITLTPIEDTSEPS